MGIFVTSLVEGQEGMRYQSDEDSSWVEVSVFQAAPGDVDANRTINGLDIQRINSFGLFGKLEDPGEPYVWPPDWPQGDFDGNELVNGLDIQAIQSTGWFAQGTYSTPAESAAAGGPGASHETVDLIVTRRGLIVDTHGENVNSWRLTSADGLLTGDDANLPGIFHSDDDTVIGSSFFQFNGQHVLGDVIGESIGRGRLHKDLTFTYTLHGTAGVHEADLVFGARADADFSLIDSYDPSALMPAEQSPGWLYWFGDGAAAADQQETEDI